MHEGEDRSMTRVFVVNRKMLIYAAGAVLLAIIALIWFQGRADSAATAGNTEVRTIHLVTAEVKGKTEDGRTIESYRWDPGTIFVNKGETVRLSLTGVSGHSHPFVIEGLNIRGEVKPGKETIVHFRADEPGVYRLICYNHSDLSTNGPMIGYIVVQ
jgi:plastocyanin